MKIIKEIENILKNQNFEIISSDFKRPWGGFIVIDENQSEKFFNFFFRSSYLKKIDFKSKLSPKILIIKPNKRLSWQYHNRRSEMWKVCNGEIDVITSNDDTERKIQTLNKGDNIKIFQGERHRIIGKDSYGIVAEIWLHSDKNYLSDEDDIVRVQDDYGR